jgi:hypothetical protein
LFKGDLSSLSISVSLFSLVLVLFLFPVSFTTRAQILALRFIRYLVYASVSPFADLAVTIIRLDKNASDHTECGLLLVITILVSIPCRRDHGSSQLALAHEKRQ